MSDVIITPSTTVIRDVNSTLKELLASRIPDLDAGNIRYDSPAEFTPSGMKSLSLFLLQVKINPYLRNLPQRPAPLAGGGTSENTFIRPPVILDLNYMLTPYGQSIDAEIELLEQIIGVMYDYAILQGDELQGSLPDQQNTRLHINPLEFGLETLNNIWSIFANKPYKRSLFYTVSPVKILPGYTFDLSRVETTVVDVKRK